MKSPENLMSLMSKYHTDDDCRETLKHLRWPKGVTCLRCQSEKVGWLKDRKLFVCYSCNYQFSVTVNTIFHDSHLSLTKWFFVTYLMTESRKGVSANQVKRMFGVSYKTAWYLCHRIRKAMDEGQKEPLTGTVEVDETWVGGRKRGVGRHAGRHNKEIVVGIRQRGGDLRFFVAPNTETHTLKKIIEENVSGDVDVIVTDDYKSYPSALKARFKGKHKTVNHSKGIYAVGEVYTNTVESAFSLLKRGIVGSWHRVSAKHLPAYLDEMTFRFNNRKNSFLFRDTLIKLLQSPVMEYKKLTAAA